MRSKKIFCVILALAMLSVSLTPLAARNTPYPGVRDVPISHPWQDDNQAEPETPEARVVINIGGIFIGFDLPSFLTPTGVKSTQTTTVESRRERVRSSAKREYRGIRNIVSPKGL